MTHNDNNTTHYQGIFLKIKSRLARNRLGEILVQDGYLSPADLRIALANARARDIRLGQYLLEQEAVSKVTLRKALAEQLMLRFMTATLTIFISMASFGMTKAAKAGGIKDVPARVAFSEAATVSPVSAFPKLFGSTEKKSYSLKAFTKWSAMFSRFDSELNTAAGQEKISAFSQKLTPYKDRPLEEMAAGVNMVMNQVRYINDSSIYGKSDYWATPIEFMARGGDCEDYAIAKYTALRMLGVPEERLRLAIVQDLQKDIPHAVLIVYTDSGAMVLDNQIKTATRADKISHYKPIFSINRDAWWLHTKPTGSVTVVASSSQ